MESDERFRPVFFFQCLWVMLCHFFNGTRCLVDDWGSVFDHFGGSRCGSGSSGGSFGFLAATAHFTWVVRRTAVFGQGNGRCGFNHRGGGFGNDGRFNHWRRLGNRYRSGFNHFDNRGWRYFYHRGRGGRFNRCGRFGCPLEGGLFFANFTHGRGGFFDNRCFYNGFNHWLWLNHRGRLSSSYFGFWLGFANRRNFHFRNHWGFDRGGCFYDRCFNHWGLGDWCLYRNGFFDGGSGAFSLLVSLGFSRCADDRAGNGSGNGQAGSQFGASRFAVGGFCVLAGFFRTFDHVAVGITLTLTTVAATTLATGAAAWTIAFGVVLAVFQQLLFAGQHFVVFFFAGASRLLGAWLTFFTRCAWLALFTWRTLFTRRASRAFFWGGGSSGSSSSGGNGRRGVQRLAQFTHTFFTLATWLAIFTRGARWAWCALFARCAFFSGYYGRGLFAGFARRRFFTGCALFTRLALFVTATVAVTALLATVATLFVTRRALGGGFFNHNRCRRLFLAGKQADQRLHQALEQAWLRQGDRGCNWGRDFNRNRCVGTRRSGLHGGFLANQGAGRGGWLDFFHFGSGSGDFVAGLAAVGFRAVITQALYFEVRRFQVIVRQDDDTGTGAQFDLGDRVAFFVEQERGNRDRHLSADFGGAVFQGFFFDQAQDRQGQRFNVTDDAGAVATRANNAAALAQGRTQALTGHFQQAEARDAADLHAGTVSFQAFADFFFHGALVLGGGHVDEVDHDQAADITQAQLAGDFFSRFQVGLQGGFFDVATFRGARRVDVDGHQGFGRVDHDGAAGRQFDHALEGGLDLAFDLETVEQRNAVFVQLDLAGVLRHHLADEGQGFVLGFNAVDQHFADVLAQVIADGADDHVAFLVDQERRGAIQRGFFDSGPQLQQVVEVPLHFFAAAAQAGSANDQPHVGWRNQAVQGFTQFVALFTFDATGNAAGTWVVRHQHQVTTGQADEGGQGRALVATFFFFYLNDDFLAFAQDVLDVHAAFGGFLEVFAGDFFEGQEAMALGAEIDKGSLKAWFDASNTAFIDVGLLLLACTGFDVQVVEALAIYQRNTQLFGLSCVNQHSFHVVPSVSGLPETAFGTHDFSRSVSGASRVVGHSSVQQ